MSTRPSREKGQTTISHHFSPVLLGKIAPLPKPICCIGLVWVKIHMPELLQIQRTQITVQMTIPSAYKEHLTSLVVVSVLEFKEANYGTNIIL